MFRLAFGCFVSMGSQCDKTVFTPMFCPNDYPIIPWLEPLLPGDRGMGDCVDLPEVVCGKNFSVNIIVEYKQESTPMCDPHNLQRGGSGCIRHEAKLVLTIIFNDFHPGLINSWPRYVISTHWKNMWVGKLWNIQDISHMPTFCCECCIVSTKHAGWQPNTSSD